MVQVADYTALLSGSTLTGRTGTAAFVTYAFPTAVPDYLTGLYPAAGLATFQPFSEAYRAVARRAIEAYAAQSGLTAYEVPSGLGDIQFMIADTTALGVPSAGFAQYPSNGTASPTASDIFIDPRYTSNDTNYYLLLHELGHALGLKHGYEGSITLAPEVDNATYSVLSSRLANGFTGSLGSFDVQAVQYLYGPAGADGSQVASWSWDAASYTLTQTGGAGADRIIGIGAGNVISAGDGDDYVGIGGIGSDSRIDTGAGNDTVSVGGSTGTLRIATGDGNDAITIASARTIVIDGGAGIDRLDLRFETGRAVDIDLSGGSASSITGVETLSLYASNLADRVVLPASADTGFFGAVYGLGGNDVLVGSNRRDTLTGGTGIDLLIGGDGDDTLYGDDSTTPDNAVDVLDGGAGNDFLYGSGGDRLSGGSGADYLTLRLVPGAPRALLDGGADRDNAAISAFDAARGQTLGSDDAELRGIETLALTGGSGADRLVTRTFAATTILNGGAGDDILFASGNGDRLSGGDGGDTVYAGPGANYITGWSNFNERPNLLVWRDYDAAIDSIEGFRPGVDRIDLSRLRLTNARIEGNYFIATAPEGTFRLYFNGNVATLGDIALTTTAILGSAAGERLGGTGGADTLIGFAGSDAIDGGAGNDTIEGGAGADTLTGGAGEDDFRDTAAGLDGDTIADFTRDDRITFLDLSPTGFGFALDGRVLSYTGGSLTFAAAPAGRLALKAGALGEVVLAIDRDVDNDFNGDGRSDILWRNANGRLTDWFSTGTGFNGATGVDYFVGTEWRIASNADFTGDGRTDILFRNTNGRVTTWNATTTGFDGATGVDYQLTGDWKVGGTGDFNGDGRDDILWRNDNGRITTWASTGTGFNGATGVDYFVGSDWKVASTGDFNGDGRDDILWRNDNGRITTWAGTATGFDGATGVDYQLTADWKVAGTGDFNGDGRDDILWRNDNGALTSWFATTTGGFAQGPFNAQVATAWSVVDTGDYNGDGRADILWRNADGSLIDWVSAGTGFDPNPASAVTVGTDWMIFG